jgi:alpha-1,2-mannosyltransferase
MSDLVGATTGGIGDAATALRCASRLTKIGARFALVRAFHLSYLSGDTAPSAASQGCQQPRSGGMDSSVRRKDLEPPRTWERCALLTFLLALIVFGVMLEIRCVYLPNRQTDLGVYLRAAWAARAGENPYTVKDENGWHFCYPPVVAMAFMPLADAPQGADRTLMVPWAVSVILWYLLSLICLFVAVHWLAKILESRSRDLAIRNMPWGCRRWWFDRMFPVLICLVQIGGTLSRGQVHFIVLLCVAGALAAVMNRQGLRCGLWLAAAICLKVIPAFLVLFPLWRRDGRALVGVAIGLGIGLFVLPALYWGIPQSWQLSWEMVEAVLHPGLRQGGDQTRAEELTNITATDNQSFQAILHNYQYWGRLNSRPGQPAPWARAAHWLISGALTLSILLAAGWRRNDDPVHGLLLLGALLLTMTLVTPVSHLHYFSLALPLVMGLYAAGLNARPGDVLPRPALLALLVIAALGYALPSIPVWEGRREAGLPMIASLILLVVGMGVLWVQRRRRQAMSNLERRIRLAA